ncbi:antibiotic biosynthesis monooxygenase [Sphingobium phenoxybenzoativorans]|uniref:Antibiotic biosynthesis monooxygenase n=1 Tax=Sphingobium phenoxybenzoativorans TaxID=1592790 RepID=A0A975K3D7_9SPHN|nr:putative quinol monooxygenase [Sphingobium phenoxybenzoativorans]QUT04148.1 antibiotic biosynthesis monooxygenase [Sphingobium phenoxybenzoativorans]
MIVITGQIYTDPETLPKLYARLKSLCDPSRQEDGCLFYHMGMEDEAKGTIMAMEGWRDQASLDAHLALPSIKALLEDFEGKFSNDVQIHEVSGSQRMLV